MAFGAFLTSREIFENDIWTDVTKFRIFFYIVGKAVFAEDGVKKGNIHIQRGQYLRSLRNLREDLAYYENNSEKMYSLSVLNRKISELVEEERIAIENTKLGTLFTVINYAKYQGFDHYKGGNAEQSENSVGTPLEQQKNADGTVKERNENSIGTVKEQRWNNNNKDNKAINDNQVINIINENNSNNAIKEKTDNSFKDSFNAPIITNSVDREEEKEKTVVGPSFPSLDDSFENKKFVSNLNRSEQIASIEKSIRFTFDNADEQVYKEIQGWLMMHSYELVKEAIKVTAQLEDPPSKLSSHILTMLADWKNQGISTYEQLRERQEHTA